MCFLLVALILLSGCICLPSSTTSSYIQQSPVVSTISEKLSELGMDVQINQSGQRIDIYWEVPSASEWDVWIGLNAMRAVFDYYNVSVQQVYVHVLCCDEELGTFNLAEIPSVSEKD